MELNQIIELAISFLVGGGLLAIVTLKDKKYAAMLENISKVIESNTKTNEAWENLARQKLEDNRELKSEGERKDDKIDRLYDEISTLRNQLDRARTSAAVANMLKCQNTGCTSRLPPFGKGASIECQAKVNDEDNGDNQ